MAEKHEIVRKILDYRGLTKLKSTYVDALLAQMDVGATHSHQFEPDGHRFGPPEFEQSESAKRADSHRAGSPDSAALLSRRPATFCWPPIIRKSNCAFWRTSPVMRRSLKPFKMGQDVHARTAADLFGIALEDVDKEMRRKAKMTNYAIAYGVSGFGLAKQLGSGTAGEAQEFIKQYFVAARRQEIYRRYDATSARRWLGETLLGRRRPVPEITSPRAVERAAAERTAINHPIQGTSADAMKLAMLAVAKRIARARN